MSAIFADSAYWIALLHRRDQWHLLHLLAGPLPQAWPELSLPMLLPQSTLKTIPAP